MQIILDHINAVVVSAAVLLIMASMMLSNQSARVDGTRYYSGRTHYTQFVQIVDRDFRNIGANADTSMADIIAFQWDHLAKTIEFQTMDDTTAGAAVSRIKYEFLPASTCEVDGESVQCYGVYRYKYSGGAYQADGGSMEMITDFNINLLDSDGSPVGSDLDDTRIIDVTLMAISPFGEEDSIDQFRWNTRYAPPNLSIN